MAFDINDLMNNPAFMFGASLLANPRQPGAVGQSFGLAAKINELKQNALAQQQANALGQGNLAETTRYHTGALENEKAGRLIQQEQFQRENALTQADLALRQRQLAMQQAVTQYFAQRNGIPLDLGANTPQLPMPPNVDVLPQGGAQSQPPPDVSGAAGMAATGPTDAPPTGNTPQRSAMNPMPVPFGNGIRMERMPGQQAGQVTQPDTIDNYDPNAMDPAGPFSGRGGFGAQQPFPSQPGGTPKGRRMQRTRAGGGSLNQILNGVQQVESGGNPVAINPQSGAMGPYQFMPSTVDMIRRSNPSFNPFDPVQARQAAGQLLQQRAAAHGGNMAQALADYGGFVTKDPSGYIQKVAAASGVPINPQAAQAAQQSGAMTPGEMAQMGMMMSLAGMPAGQTLVSGANALEPKSVSGNTFQRDPMTNAMTYVPDPIASKNLELRAREINANLAKLPGELQAQQDTHVQAMGNVAKTGSELTNQQIARSHEYQADADSLYKTTNWAQNLKNSIDQLVQFDNKGNIVGMAPGFNSMTGVTGALMRHIPGSDAYNAHEQLESLLNQTKFEVVNQMKNAAGTTGLGRVLQSEFQAMGESLAPLDPNMSTQALARSLYKIRTEADKVVNHANSSFAGQYGALPGPPQTNIPQAMPGAVAQGAYAPVNGGQAFAPQDVPRVTKTINGITYVKTGPTSWARQ